MTKQLLVLMGSFRRDSFSRSIANYTVSVLPENYEATFAELQELPLFNQDIDDDGAVPEGWTTLRTQVRESDAILFVTPEHNRSFPAVLKNALDIASRPAGESVWAKKPAAIISTSPGRIGGALCNQHLRQPLAFLNLRLLLHPEMYISEVADLLDENGVLVDASTKRHLDAFAQTFAKWVETS